MNPDMPPIALHVYNGIEINLKVPQFNYLGSMKEHCIQVNIGCFLASMDVVISHISIEAIPVVAFLAASRLDIFVELSIL